MPHVATVPSGPRPPAPARHLRSAHLRFPTAQAAPVTAPGPAQSVQQLPKPSPVASSHKGSAPSENGTSQGPWGSQPGLSCHSSPRCPSSASPSTCGPQSPAMLQGDRPPGWHPPFALLQGREKPAGWGSGRPQKRGSGPEEPPAPSHALPAPTVPTTWGTPGYRTGPAVPQARASEGTVRSPTREPHRGAEPRQETAHGGSRGRRQG